MITPAHRRAGFLLLVTMMGTAGASAGVNHWTSSGPYGGNIAALVVDPSRAGRAFAAISGYGVFRTEDGGLSWAAANQGLTGAGLLPLTTVALAIDPVAPSNLYVGLEQGGAFKSVDSGATWQPIGFNDAGHSVTGIVVDPQTPSTVFLCGGFGVEKSRDAGATWQPAIAGMPAHPSVYEIAIDPAHPGTLYARVNSEQNPLYRTRDGGATWSSVAIPAGANYLNDLAVDPSSRVFVSTDRGVFRSADAGDTWVQVFAGYYLRLSVVDEDLYASGEVTDATTFQNAAFRSGDGGDHWTPLAVTVVPSIFAGGAADPNTVYGGSGAGVEKSSDRGVQWSPSSNGIQALGVRPVMDPANPALVYAASDGGALFASVDGARTWSLRAGQIAGVAIQPGTLDLFSLAGVSRDGGSTWESLDYPLSLPSPPVIVAKSPGTLFTATTTNPGPDVAQVFESQDSGSTWRLVYDADLSSGISSFVASASGSNLYAAVEGFAIREFVQSRDGGVTWNAVDTTGWPVDWWASFDALAIDPIDENVVYALQGGKLWRSLVGGGQWQEIDSGIPPSAIPYLPLVSNLVIDPTSPTSLYASTPEGVYRSLDRGASWIPFSDGLPAGPTSGLVIDATGRFLHVSAGGGVYDDEIGGACGTTGGELCLLGGRFVVTAQAIDPRTGRLQVGTALSQTDRWGYFSLPAFTGDPNFPEIVVKLADATSIDGGFWFFHSGLTDLQYTVSVLDTVTGRQKSYRNDRSDPQKLCGGADTETFAVDAPPGPVPARERAARPRTSGASDALSLLSRFTATLTAADPRTGRVAAGVPVPRDAKWGYFSLPDFTGDPSFPEVFVKMLDATALPEGAFWVFHTGLTDLQYTLTVTDSMTGEQKAYRNDRSDPNLLCGGADTQAFP